MGGGEERGGGWQKRNDVVMSYIWPSYVGAPVWCVKILPALRRAGTAIARGEESDADGVEREPVKGRFCVSSPSLEVSRVFQWGEDGRLWV